MTDATTTPEGFQITVAWREDEQPVGKTASIGPDGAVQVKTGVGHPDRYEVHTVATPKELAQLVAGMGPSQLILAGVPKAGTLCGPVVLAVALDRGHGGPDAIALTTTALDWPQGPGVMVLDHDRKTQAEGWLPHLDVSMGDFAGVIDKVAPGLTSMSAGWPSSSSCITGPDGTEHRGVLGFHRAVIVADAADIPRAGSVLFKRLVLAGYGFGFVTKAGTVHVRTVVDGAVWRPSHKFFVGGVDTRDGLVQTRAPHFRASHGAKPADTREILPDLTEAEAEQYAAECQRLLALSEPLAAAQRTTYTAERVAGRAATIATRHNLPAADALARAEEQIAEEQDSRTTKAGKATAQLCGDAEIVTARGVVTVDEILAEPKLWDRVLCADPFEPDYGTGVGMSRIHTGGVANIHGFAHGSCTYYLKRSAASEFDEFGDQDAMAATVQAPAAMASQVAPATGAALVAADTAPALADAAAPEPRAKGIRNASDLWNKDFPPVAWLVEGLIPRGAFLLGGKPKLGKSWLMLELLLAVATDALFLGRKVDAGRCLYISLEDGERRLQERIKRLMSEFTDPSELSNFSYETEWPRADDAVLRLDVYLKENPGVKVVVCDTLARIKAPAGTRGTAYDQDYSALAPWQSLSARRGVTIILVTHVKKQPSDDIFDSITGSLGQGGAVDGMLVLLKHKTNSKQLLLGARGRDLDGDIELVLARDDAGHFSDLGDAAEVVMDGTRREVIEYLQDRGGAGATATEVSTALGKKSVSSTRQLLNRMADDGAVVTRDQRYYIEKSCPDWVAGGAPAVAAAKGVGGGLLLLQ